MGQTVQPLLGLVFSKTAVRYSSAYRKSFSIDVREVCRVPSRVAVVGVGGTPGAGRPATVSKATWRSPGLVSTVTSGSASFIKLS